MANETSERLARVEEQTTSLHEAVVALVDAQKETGRQISEMVSKVADLAATLAHPDPAHCIQGGGIADLRRDVTGLKSDRDKAAGVLSLVKWFLGSSVVVQGLAALYYIATHLPHVLKP